MLDHNGGDILIQSGIHFLRQSWFDGTGLGSYRDASSKDRIAEEVREQEPNSVSDLGKTSTKDVVQLSMVKAAHSGSM